MVAVVRLPWVSRSALDVAQGEIAFLREHVRDLTDRVARMERHSLGMPETPRQPKPVFQPMPKALKDHIDGFASGVTRKDMRDRLYRKHTAGAPWAEIMNEVMKDER